MLRQAWWAICLILSLSTVPALAQDQSNAVDANDFAWPPPPSQDSFFVRPNVHQSSAPLSGELSAQGQAAPPATPSTPVSPGKFFGQLLNGQVDQSSLQKMLMGEARELKSDIFNLPAHSRFQMSLEDRRDLANCDLAIIIDHSGSMKTRDCPGFSFPGGLNSRLEWVVDELTIFANNIIAGMPHGFSLITFDDQPQSFEINNVAELQQVLSSLRPGGGTRLEAALQRAFQLHNEHLDQPLLIAVITDGEVNVRESGQMIAEGTRAFLPPNGLSITILQVGTIAEATTAPRLAVLTSVMPMGAMYPCLTGVPFNRLRKDGLGNDVLWALHSRLRTAAVPFTRPPEN